MLVSAIDNLLMGACGQAVQNMNVMLGLDERGAAVTRWRRAPLVVKFGGELLEDPSRGSVLAVVSAIARASASGAAACLEMVIIHGGGKEIDAALKVAGIEKRQVDGLRITDEPTLDVVVSVLAGTVNTRFVAALTTAGVPAVGLTGADAACGLCDEAPPHRAMDGRTVDLGRVGVPSDRSDTRLLATLARARASSRSSPASAWAAMDGCST